MKKTLFIFTLLSLINFSIKSQTLQNKSPNNDLSSTQLIERVYLQTDRSMYIAGEKIHFSAFCFDAAFHMPLDFSKVLYVELYTQDNAPLKQIKIKLNNGTGYGFIEIPKKTPTNYYFIRAYTNYMKNFGSESYFSNRISILNPFINTQTTRISIEKQAQIQVFTETKQFINETKNKIMIQCTDPLGHPLSTKVFVIDEKDSINTTVTTDQSGMAVFSFIPKNKQTYRFMTIYKKEKIITERKAQALQNSALILKNITENQAEFNILHVQNQSYPLQLKISNTGWKNLINNKIEKRNQNIKISLSDFPEGILCLELLDKNNKSIHQRYFYNKNKEQTATIKLQTNKKQYATRENAVVKINTEDGQLDSIAPNFSIFINFTDSLQSNASLNFNELFLLTEIKQHFPAKAHRFHEHILTHAENINDYLIIPGKTKKQQSITPENLTFLPEIKGDIITGNVSVGNKPVPGLEIYQSFVDSICWIEPAISDSAGNFYILTEHSSNEDLLIRAKDTLKQYNIKIENEFSNDFQPVQKENFIPPQELAAFIKQQMFNVQVIDAYKNKLEVISAHLKTEKQKPFYGIAENRYNFRRYLDLPDFEEFIFEILRGVRSYRDKSQKKIMIISSANPHYTGKKPLIIIDGLPLFSHTDILSLNPENLNDIKLVTYNYFYKNQFFNGILDIKTAKNNFSGLSLPKNTIRINFTGIQQSSPLQSLKQVASHDQRTPLYNNLIFKLNQLNPDTDGKLKLNFITPDYPGYFTIQAFGINQNGKINISPLIIEVTE